MYIKHMLVDVPRYFTKVTTVNWCLPCMSDMSVDLPKHCTEVTTVNWFLPIIGKTAHKQAIVKCFLQITL